MILPADFDADLPTFALTGGHYVILVSSGAVAMGCHRLGLESKPDCLAQRQALAAVGQGHLMMYYENMLEACGLKTAQVLVSLENLSVRGQYDNVRNTFTELLAYGVVPVVNENDSTSIQKLRFGDNDTLAAHVAAMLQANWLFLMTDVDHLYTSNPKTNPDATPIYEVHDMVKLDADTSEGEGTQWGTGGMATKLTAARIAIAAGTTMAILNCQQPEKVVDVVNGIEKIGTKIGFVGLAEEEWLETLGHVPLTDVRYIDFVAEGRRLAAQLRSEGCELVVAVTHMRVPNDMKLTSEAPEFDLVLGGHDHSYHCEIVPPHGVLLVKSGTDFRDVTRISVALPPVGAPGRPQASWTRLPVTSSVKLDPGVAAIVEHYAGEMQRRMVRVIGRSLTELDGRCAVVRSQESNLANFVCDVVRKATGADVVLVQGGSFRSDTVHPAGGFTLHDLLSVLPVADPMVVIAITGSQLLEALENGVSEYPKKEGRFPQVSGVRFSFDPSRPPDKRVVPGSVTVGGAPLVVDKEYTLCTKTYLADGKDGYDVLQACRVVVDHEDVTTLQACVRNHFRCLAVLTRVDPKVTLKRVAAAWMAKAGVGQGGGSEAEEDEGVDVASIPSRGNHHGAEEYEEYAGLCVLEPEGYSIEAVVDGRIGMVGA
ncbi:hypothetical protein FOA52_004450 [Chlamydomonas sp. UWO 241]|nr:hypothetical protein FOA52_004450 [Chlamydomonas sp. UWO 241]